jgi:aryl-alcohol dehydrogenase-like predicted oxidoreductase
MQTRTIGTRTVGEVGFGAMHFSFREPVDEPRSIRAVHAAIDAGVTLIDTALCYTTLDAESHNETVVRRALGSHPRGSDVLVATKGGHWRAGREDFPKDGRPDAIRRHCEISLRSLGVECLGLYQLHWPDPATPIAESMGAFADLQREGKVELVGVSNFSAEQLAEAQTEVDVASVQNRFSPTHPEDRAMVDLCAEQGIAYLPWGPLGSASVPAFAEVAAELDVSPQRVIVAWHLAQSPTVIPIPGTRHAESIVDLAAASALELSAEQLARLG